MYIASNLYQIHIQPDPRQFQTILLATCSAEYSRHITSTSNTIREGAPSITTLFAEMTIKYSDTPPGVTRNSATGISTGSPTLAAVQTGCI